MTEKYDEKYSRKMLKTLKWEQHELAKMFRRAEKNVVS
jgi:hypothetical protein